MLQAEHYWNCEQKWSFLREEEKPISHLTATNKSPLETGGNSLDNAQGTWTKGDVRTQHLPHM